jgi:choline dehydrogenase
MATQTGSGSEYDYVIVGSGAGGGTVAARLAEAGYRVAVLEAGGDPRTLQGSDATSSDNRLPEDYDVPVFHALSTENEAMKWDYFVRHYADPARQKLDPKYCATYQGREVDGVLYPRAGTLGGCTAHNAMIFLYPHNEDWQYIEQLTGDPSWSPDNMRSYFERLENCQHRPIWRWLSKLGIAPTRHGWNGWLHIQKEIPEAVLDDIKLIKVVLESAGEAFEDALNPLRRLLWLLAGGADPNDWRLVKDAAEGIRYTPLANRNHARMGTRERLRETAARLPDKLHIHLDCLATRVLFNDQNRAVGVEYLKGKQLFRADSKQRSGIPGVLHAAREVILCAGAFNTPQLLMLSGVGPRAHLQAHGVPVRIDIPGVGGNLQDRYEVGVVNRMNFKQWYVLKGARFAKGDPQYQEWQQQRSGVYATNGAVLAVIKRSLKERPLPDLCCFALLGLFKGYFPGYSALFPQHLNYLTWAILKAHTNNRAGEVRLRSADPRDAPAVNFRYFEEGSDASGDDLQSVVEGIKFVRHLTADLKKPNVLGKALIAAEEEPGEHVRTDDELREYVRNHAWGHHASCTCPIGPVADGGVVDGNFRVHGTSGLRIVDASVFPRIPGFFIVSAIYMIGEKAADVIAADARSSK